MCVFHPGPTKEFNFNLVGKQVLHVTGDRVIIQTEVGASSGNFISGQDFLVCFPDLYLEPWESCHFNPDFPDLNRLKHIVQYHSLVIFQPFD